MVRAMLDDGESTFSCRVGTNTAVETGYIDDSMALFLM